MVDVQRQIKQLKDDSAATYYGLCAASALGASYFGGSSGLKNIGLRSMLSRSLFNDRMIAQLEARWDKGFQAPTLELDLEMNGPLPGSNFVLPNEFDVHNSMQLKETSAQVGIRTTERNSHFEVKHNHVTCKTLLEGRTRGSITKDISYAADAVLSEKNCGVAFAFIVTFNSKR